MSEYVSVSELPTAQEFTMLDFLHGNVPPVVWNVNLPGAVDAERIVLNTDAIRRYQRVGAISSSLVLEYQGDQSEFTPGLNGINADGSAMATKAGTVKKADKSKADILDPVDIPAFASKDFGRPVMLHQLNKAEMTSRLSDDVRNKGMSREAAWAKQLDASFRESFRKGGSKHLKDRVGRLAVFDYAIFSYLGGVLALDVATGDVQSTALLTGIWATGQTIMTGITSARLKQLTGSAHLKDKRWSVFYANHQTDRYLALNAMSRVPGLISARK